VHNEMTIDFQTLKGGAIK